MPRYMFVGPDPIDHFTLGRIDPGAVHELDAQPPGPWRPVPRARRVQSADQHDPGTEHGSDASDDSQED